MMNKYFLTLIFIISCAHPRTDDHDHYKNFAELNNHQEADKDYKIQIKKTKTPILIMSIHGCNIEQGTSELAEMVAGNDFNFYNFCGLKTSNDENKFLLDSLLHITSTHFDEPSLIAMTKTAKSCLSLHGYQGDKADFCVGGRDDELRQRIVAKLKQELPQFSTCDLCCPPYLGLAHKNPVNRCQYQGVQIEMGPKVRKAIIENSSFKERLSILLRLTLGQ